MAQEVSYGPEVSISSKVTCGPEVSFGEDLWNRGYCLKIMLLQIKSKQCATLMLVTFLKTARSPVHSFNRLFILPIADLRFSRPHVGLAIVSYWVSCGRRAASGELWPPSRLGYNPGIAPGPGPCNVTGSHLVGVHLDPRLPVLILWLCNGLRAPKELSYPKSFVTKPNEDGISSVFYEVKLGERSFSRFCLLEISLTADQTCKWADVLAG